MKLRTPTAFALSMLLLVAAISATALPGCESFYGYVDSDGNEISEVDRRADAQARLNAMTDARDRLQYAIDTARAQRDAFAGQAADLREQLAALQAAGADTSSIDEAIERVEGVIELAGPKIDELGEKLAEVDTSLEGLQAEVDDGTLGGAAVTTVAAIEGAQKVAPLAGPYGEIASVGLGILAMFFRSRGKSIAADRDRRKRENAGLINSVGVLLDSDVIDDGNGGKAKAKKILAGAQDAETRAAARRILSGVE